MLVCIMAVALLPMGVALANGDGFPRATTGSHPPWIVDAPDFAARALHWASEGQEPFVHGEFLIEIAEDGTIRRAHKRFSDEHSDVVQASI